MGRRVVGLGHGQGVGGGRGQEGRSGEGLRGNYRVGRGPLVNAVVRGGARGGG